MFDLPMRKAVKRVRKVEKKRAIHNESRTLKMGQTFLRVGRELARLGQYITRSSVAKLKGGRGTRKLHRST